MALVKPAKKQITTTVVISDRGKSDTKIQSDRRVRLNPFKVNASEMAHHSYARLTLDY